MNFALILFIALVITGAIWLLDHLFLAKERAAASRAAPATAGTAHAGISSSGATTSCHSHDAT